MAVAVRPVTPKSLILDLLRVAAPHAMTVRVCVAIGKLFGLSGNAMRVALTRLTAQGMLESDERGSYRLAPAASGLSEHVEQWRFGERRVRRWNGAYLACWLSRGVERPARRRSLRALELLGFRQGLDGLHLRPDNLATPVAVTFEKLRGLGLEDAAHGFVAQGFDEVLEAQARALWSGKQLVRGYRQARESLERSALRVESLPVEEAAVETFLLGGAAIHLLATDPLLPSEIVATGERGRLADAMLAYDALGRRIWSKLLRDVRVGEAPAHLSLMTGGAG